MTPQNKALIFLAEGFEEIEALTPVDLLRRAGKEVVIAGVGGKNITGRSNITVTADIEVAEINLDAAPDLIILPGGMPGTENLFNSEKVREVVSFCAEKKALIAAICAAPSVLGRMGLLKGKKATCYTGFEKYLDGAEVSAESVVRDDNFITAKGAGVSVEFALALIEALYSAEKAKEIAGSIHFNAR